MTADTNTDNDSIVTEIRDMLQQYKEDYPNANTGTYRYNSASVRIKIEDPRFANMPKGERHDDVWENYVSKLSSDTQSDISMLLLVAPGELTLLGAEFSQPSKSQL